MSRETEIETLPSPNERQPPDPTWTTHDGRKLKVSAMDDGHLHNARNWALRAARTLDQWALNAGSYASGAPDGAADAAELSAGEYLERAENLRRWANLFSRVLKERERARGPDA